MNRKITEIVIFAKKYKLIKWSHATVHKQQMSYHMTVQMSAWRLESVRSRLFDFCYSLKFERH